MKNGITYLLLITFGFLLCSIATGQDHNIPKPARQASLPDNPCEVLSAEQVSAVTGLEVISAERIPSLGQVVDAQREGREPSPGTICYYETRSDFGAIWIAVPTRKERRAALYWEGRAKYFQTYPGSARPVADLGTDAWLGGGTTLHVLVRGDEHFSLSTQMYQERSRELLTHIARVVLSRL